MYSNIGKEWREDGEEEKIILDGIGVIDPLSGANTQLEVCFPHLTAHRHSLRVSITQSLGRLTCHL